MGDDLTVATQQFLRLYAQDAMGYPSNIPKSYIDNPTLNIKGTPYAAWADNVVVDKLNKIKKKLGIGSKEQIPEELKELTISDVRNWTNFEAKFQLMSLLAHPKSMVGNIYGGTSQTIASAGLKNLRQGRDFAWLRANLNPSWEKPEDIQTHVEKVGIIEDFLITEANFNPETKDAKFQSFFKEAVAKIKQDPI